MPRRIGIMMPSARNTASTRLPGSRTSTGPGRHRAEQDDQRQRAQRHDPLLTKYRPKWCRRHHLPGSRTTAWWRWAGQRVVEDRPGLDRVDQDQRDREQRQQRVPPAAPHARPDGPHWDARVHRGIKAGRWRDGRVRASGRSLTHQPALHRDEAQAHAGQDHQEHQRGYRRAHVAADLRLVAEEGAVEQRAEDVGGVVGPPARLGRIDQVEGALKLPTKVRDGDQPQRRVDQRQL